MATYVVQGHWGPQGDRRALQATGTVGYSLTSGANGTALTGTGDVLLVHADAAGWLHVSRSAAADKADAATFKSHRIPAAWPYPVDGVLKGDFVSFVIG